MAQPVLGQHIEQFIAVVQTTLGIDHLQAIGVAVQCDAIVSPMRQHRRHHGLGVGGPHALVDVEPVGRAAHGHHLGTQLLEHLGGHLVGRAMRGIDHQLQAFEAELGVDRAFAKFNVTTRRIVQTPGFAQGL